MPLFLTDIKATLIGDTSIGIEKMESENIAINSERGKCLLKSIQVFNFFALYSCIAFDVRVNHEVVLSAFQFPFAWPQQFMVFRSLTP